MEVTEAKIRMELGAKEQGREFSSLVIDSVEEVKKMNDKVAFLSDCQEYAKWYDLKVPKFKIMPKDVSTELFNLKVSGFFDKKRRFALKTLTEYSDSEGVIVPTDNTAFENFMKKLYIDEKKNYILVETFEGDEYLANVICREGKIHMLQVRKISFWRFF